MATSNRYLREREEQKQQDLASLELLSRDLKAYKKGPKEVKIKAAPKYVTGVTKSQGDEEYASNIRAFGSKQLARAFGMNMGMSAVQQEILNDLEAKYGSGDGVREFVDLSTQVICHLLIQAATFAVEGTDAKAALPFIYDFAMNKLESTDSISSMLDALNAITDASTTGVIPARGTAAAAQSVIGGKVYRFLRPLNLAHIERVDARYSPRIRSRNAMLEYIANAEAQNAVIRYMTDHALPDDVLAPAAIPEGADASTVQSAFEKYPAKDIVSTFDYYSKAVEKNLDMSMGIQVGDVKAFLDGAASALRGASSEMAQTGLRREIQNLFKRGFDSAASKISRLSPTSSTTDEDIAFIVAELADLLNAYNGVGTSSASRKTSRLLGAGLLPSQTLGSRVLEILKTEPSAQSIGGSGAFARENIEYLDAADEICPRDVNIQPRQGNRKFLGVQNEIGIAFINLRDAHNALIPVGRLEDTSRPQGLTSGTLRPTQAFADLVAKLINDFQTRVEKRMPLVVDGETFKRAMHEAYAQMLGATAFGPAGINDLKTDLIFTGVGTDAYNCNWGIPESRLNQFASGDTVSFGAVEQVILDLVDQRGRMLSSRKIRTATRDYSIASAKLLSDVIRSFKAQAENTNIALQTRRNPAMSTGQMVLTGTGSLVGTHAVSAGLNRVVQPASGSITAHAVDYMPSLAVAGYGIYKAQQGDKDLGYSLAGGAAAHMALRYMFTKMPALRFSENPFLKALQAPTNGLAHIVGDESMAASALTPASIDGKEDVGAYVLGLVNANDCPSLCYIACQLVKSGLKTTDKSYLDGVDAEDTALVLTVGQGVAEPAAQNCLDMARALVKLKCSMEVHGLKAMLENRKGLMFLGSGSFNGAKVNFKTPTGSDICKERLEKCKDTISKICNVPVTELSGFILEPGYNMDVYSGEDQVSYLQPAPSQTAQSGFAQLENAISRARTLGPQDLLQEGIGDLQDVSIIRATPKTARKIEKAGMGTSLGMSRMNPANELVALEVQGANGLMPVAPARQHSVPQGALNYAKIGHASDVTVSSEGLFNQGIFTPRYGR
jgi:hypothetical protein